MEATGTISLLSVGAVASEEGTHTAGPDLNAGVWTLTPCAGANKCAIPLTR